MKTRDRLDDAYTTAPVEEFDDDARYVFLSDAHRGDGSAHDEFAKNSNTFLVALDHYLAEGFTLVELGDSDDLWEFQYRYILRAHAPVWDRIRRFHELGRYRRLYGNHDHQLSDPGFVRRELDAVRDPATGRREAFLRGLQPLPALRLRRRGTRDEILAVHGHQGDFSNDQNWRVTMTTFRLFWKYLHMFGIHSPTSPVRNSFKRHKVERNYTRWIRRTGIPLICGHTHRERFPREDDPPYLNTGGCSLPRYMSGIELADGMLTLVHWRVEPDADGYLRVRRRAIAGPRPLADLARDRARF